MRLRTAGTGLGGTAFYRNPDTLATNCAHWYDFCLPNSNWDYANVVLNSYYLDGVSSQWKQAVAGHEFGHGAPALWHTGFPPNPFACPCTFADQLMFASAGYAYDTYGSYTPKWNDIFNAELAY